MSTLTDKFWEHKSLESLNQLEWEALCDGCGKCCLHKIEDEDTGYVHFTKVACKLFNNSNCLCSNYNNRHNYVPDCLKLTPTTVKENIYWLPSTCAYKLLYQEKPLPEWHPLITGNKNTVHQNKDSIKGKTVSEKTINENEWINYII